MARRLSENESWLVVHALLHLLVHRVSGGIRVRVRVRVRVREKIDSLEDGGPTGYPQSADCGFEVVLESGIRRSELKALRRVADGSAALT